MTTTRKRAARSKLEEAEALFREHGGTLRTGQALALGVHPRTLYAMRDAGTIEPLSRGLYRLAGLPPLGNPDLVGVSLRAPDAVVCLVSALAFHEITTQIPHEVYIALRRGAYPPDLDHPPLRVFWFTGPAYTEGAESHSIDGAPVRIYGPEKTLADCFKYRNKIGMDTVLEALRLYRQRGRMDVDGLVRFARICRVEKIMRPYLEAVL